ncbi:MAG: restriction endonuclease subunit S [Candidatus Acidiferrales bacterium]
MSAHYPSTCLNEIVTPVERPTTPLAGQIYRQLGVQLWGRGAYEREELEGSQTKYKTLSRVETGDIIVNKIWARNGSVAVVPSELSGCYVSGEFPTFAPLPDKLEPAWFHWYTKTPALWQQCDEKSRGTSGKNRIRPEKFLEVEIPLPPLDEQHRIVSLIEQLAAKVETAQALRHETADAAQKLVGVEIQSLFTAPPPGWSSGYLGDYISDACYGTSEKTTDDPSGTPILRMGNIQNGRLLTSDLKYLHITPKEYPKLFLQKGDILVNRTNSAELVGKCAVFDLDGEFGFASYIIRLRLDTSRALPQLVASYINSPPGRAYMFNERKQMTGQANVNLQKLRALPISLPSLSEQARLLAHLGDLESRVDGLKRLQSETGAELDALMPSILSKAFRGEL